MMVGMLVLLLHAPSSRHVPSDNAMHHTYQPPPPYCPDYALTLPSARQLGRLYVDIVGTSKVNVHPLLIIGIIGQADPSSEDVEIVNGVSRNVIPTFDVGRFGSQELGVGQVLPYVGGGVADPRLDDVLAGDFLRGVGGALKPIVLHSSHSFYHLLSSIAD